MARQRNLWPEFFTNEELVEAERKAGLPLRVIYAGLWCQADREGRFKWEPGRLKLAIAPYDLIDMSAALLALVDSRHVVQYEVDGSTFGWVPTFRKYQRIHPREAASRIPPAPGDGSPLDVQGLPSANRGAPRANPSTAKDDQGQAITSGMSGPSESQDLRTEPPHHARGRATELPRGWNEATLSAQLPANCHANLRRVLIHSGRGGEAAAMAIAAMCGIDPKGITVGMLTCSVEEMAAVINRVASAADPKWHQAFANRTLESIRRESTRPTPVAAPRAPRQPVRIPEA